MHISSDGGKIDNWLQVGRLTYTANILIIPMWPHQALLASYKVFYLIVKKGLLIVINFIVALWEKNN